MTSGSGIVLASASPRRRELLALTGWDFSICSSPVPESQEDGEKPVELAKRLAQSKAEAARETCPGEPLIIAADTLVVHNGEVLGKPLDAGEARTMLRRLGGLSHEVVTAIVIETQDGSLIPETCSSRVPMRSYDEAEIDAYINGGSPLDKAGAYGIQDPEFHPVDPEQFRDCYANVMGLPLCHLVRAMRGIGSDTPNEVPSRCMQFTGYDCRIYPTILRGDL